MHRVTTAALARRVGLAPPPVGSLQDPAIACNHTGNSLQTVVCFDDSGEHRRACIVSFSFRSNSVLGHSVAMVSMQGHRQVTIVRPTAPNHRHSLGLISILPLLPAGSKLMPAALRLAGVERQTSWFQCATTDRRCPTADTGPACLYVLDTPPAGAAHLRISI